MKRGKIMKELLALGCQEIKILFNARWVASLYMPLGRPCCHGQGMVCFGTRAGARQVGVPGSGKDLICMNTHRMYGPVMYSHLFANWDQVWSEIKSVPEMSTDCLAGQQPIHVLQKNVES